MLTLKYRKRRPVQLAASRKRAPSKRKKRVVKKKRGSSLLRTLFKFLLLLSFIAVCVFALWVWSLNKTVVDGFALSKDRGTVHMYSRSHEIKAGHPMSLDKLLQALRNRGYQEVSKIGAPLQFAYQQQTVDIFAPAERKWLKQPQAQAVRIVLQEGAVQSLTDHRTGKATQQFSLAPELIGNLSDGPVQDRLEIKLHQAPPFLLDAVLTMEDRRFTHHIGIDPIGIARALLTHVRRDVRRQGGSTITQQLVKNIYLDSSRTLKRKLKEAVMAVLVEANFSKAQILERYLNTIFLGQSGNRAIHGFGLAAKFYFSRDIAKLNPAQISTLVGLIPAPSKYNPQRHPQRATERRNLVLNTASANGFISEAEAKLYGEKPLDVKSSQAQQERYPVFTQLLNEQLGETFDPSFISLGGWDVYTTLDASIQQQAESTFKKALGALETEHKLDKNFLQGAMIIVEPQSGEIIAIIGDSNNQSAGFNRALDAKRPVGSLIKPAVYLTALQNPERYALTTRIVDAPISIPVENGEPWEPHNYDDAFHGAPSVYEALARSYNVPAVKVGLDVGIESVLTTIKALGIDTPLPAYPSITLGSANLSVLEMAQMYQTLANRGKLQKLRTIKTVTRRSGAVISQHKTQGQQMINPAAVYLLQTVLQEATRTGTGRALQTLLPGVQLAGKTGTTNDYRDSWFAGFSGNYLGLVWVGNDANKSTGLTGSSGALRVWAKVMADLDLQSLSDQIPSNVQQVQVDAASGALAVQGCTQTPVVRAFVKGYAPLGNSACGQGGVASLGDIGRAEPNNNSSSSTPSLSSWLERLFKNNKQGGDNQTKPDQASNSTQQGSEKAGKAQSQSSSKLKKVTIKQEQKEKKRKEARIEQQQGSGAR